MWKKCRSKNAGCRTKKELGEVGGRCKVALDVRLDLRSASRILSSALVILARGRRRDADGTGQISSALKGPRSVGLSWLRWNSLGRLISTADWIRRGSNSGTLATALVMCSCTQRSVRSSHSAMRVCDRPSMKWRMQISFSRGVSRWRRSNTVLGVFNVCFILSKARIRRFFGEKCVQVVDCALVEKNISVF